jgi:hypothetical protein
MMEDKNRIIIAWVIVIGVSNCYCYFGIISSQTSTLIVIRQLFLTIQNRQDDNHMSGVKGLLSLNREDYLTPKQGLDLIPKPNPNGPPGPLGP